MDIRTLVLMPLVTALAVSALAGPAAEDGKAAQVLAQTRQAIGGGRLQSLRTFAADATVQRNMGSVQVSSEVELLLQLPDKYLRSEQGGGPVGAAMSMGFNGEAPIKPANASFGPGGAMMIRMGPGGPLRHAEKLPPEEQARLDRELVRSHRADISRLMLGWFAMALPALDVRYSYAGEAESPDGKAHVLDAKAADGFSARLFIDQDTHLPLMVTYQGAPPRVVTREDRRPGGGGREMSDDERRRLRAEAEQDVKRLQSERPAMVEMTLFFEDWRAAGGVQFPHKIRRAAAGTTHEEWTVNRARINPTIDPKRFEG
jgi:hypothetical protein